MPKLSNLFEPFLFPGTVSLTIDDEKRKVSVLRDTVAAQSLILGSILPAIEKNYTGDHAILKDLFGTPTPPLAKVHLHTTMIHGEVIVGVRKDQLPVEEAHFLLGNYLAGSLVIPHPIATSSPIGENNLVNFDEDCSVYPSCAVTRSRSRGNGERYFLYSSD